MDQLRLIRIINFFAQIADIYIYDIGIAVMIHVPYIRLYLLAQLCHASERWALELNLQISLPPLQISAKIQTAHT